MYQRSASRNTMLGLLLALVPGQFENQRKGLECTVCSWAYFPGILGILCYLHVPRHQVCVFCCVFNRTLLTMAIGVQHL